MFEALTQHLKLPDLWQHAAVNHLRAGSDVIVSAPTGAGKTYVFELFVKAAPPKGQAVYTVPTRALANDKFAEWTEAGWKVGLATGDRAVNVHAPVLVATLETQIERILTGQGPELLVIDEFQMIGDPARGSHYEGAIVLAGAGTRLLLLSGSVENSEDVAAWMRRIGRSVEVVSAKERPVPLEETPVEVLPQKVRGLEGYWPKFAASVLMADLGPLLIFAPRRKDAEKIAKQLADQLPQGEPLSLTQEQKSLAGKDVAALLEKRIAYHHSGLSYPVRAGLVEPLAKGGQLRVIVSTMGLAAGINFSVRSVHVSSTMYHDGTMEKQLAADELLQMYGRAGRRGLDERGYVLSSRTSPTLADARPARLRRSSKLSWPLFLRIVRRAALDGHSPFQAALEFAQRLFAKVPPELGLEETTDQAAAAPAGRSGALFGLTGTRHEMRNSAGQWEEVKVKKEAQVSLGEAWRATEGYHGPALGDAGYVRDLPGATGRIFKLVRREGAQLYGKETALGKAPEEGSSGIVPTQSLRKLLKIPPHLPVLTEEQVRDKALPRLGAHFPGTNLLGTQVKDNLLWAQFDYSTQLVTALQDSLGRWVVTPEERTVQRATETGIQMNTAVPDQTTRPGTPVHAWRTLGLVDSDGSPTRRGVIFSYFQHGEGLAVAAALEDESYPVDELAIHMANLRSDCRLEMTEPGGSERLAAACRGIYGYVNHAGYLEAGLPIGYGEGTAELLGLLEGHGVTRPSPQRDAVAEGDLTRAHVEWLSLLRHVVHAPAHDWDRWQQLKAACAGLLEKQASSGALTMNFHVPPLTPKQKHDRPKHFFMRY